MTRIIAGVARGRRLKVPAAQTRPTSDRVREALFSSLDSAAFVRGARVLDLYAGSGALGLEAASRGASQVTLVESSGQAVKTIAENTRVVGLPGVTCVKARVQDFLGGPGQPYDLVLLDPPYDVPGEEIDQFLEALAERWLAPEAVVVVERGAADHAVRWPAGFGDHWVRRFGGTHVARAVWYGLNRP